MNIKRLFILVLVISILFSVAVVSAADNETSIEIITQTNKTDLIEITDEDVGLKNTQNQELLSADSNSRVIYVGENKTSDGGNGLSDNPFNSFELACNNLSGEEKVEINVYNGTYYLDSDLKFNTSNLFISGMGGDVILKNLNNETHSSFGLTSPKANFTFSNIIFDSDNVNKALFYVFKDTCSLGIFNNCTFTNFNNTLMFTANFNKRFNSCNFINSHSSYFTLTRLYKDTINEFNYCIVSSSYGNFAEKIYLGSNISFNNVWFGQNILPNYIYPPFADVYERIDYQAYVYGYEIPVTRYAIFNAYENYLGNNTYEIIGKLVWNDTTTDNLDKLNPMTVKLTSSTGILSSNTTILENGTFKVIYKSYSVNNKVKVVLNSETVNLNFHEEIDVSCQPIYYGENQNITISLPQNSKGAVNVSVDNTTYEINVSSSLFNFTIPDQLSAGSHKVHVKFCDSVNHYYGSSSVELVIFKNNFELLVLTPAEAYINEDSIYLSVLLPNDANGSVSISIGDKNLTQKVNGGETNINISSLLNNGDNNVTVSYADDVKYLNQSKSCIVSVDKVYANMNITVPANARIDSDNITLKVMLPSDACGNLSIFANSKNLTMKVNGGEIGINVLSLVKGGDNHVKIVYSGDDYYKGQVKNVIVNVEKITPKINITFKDEVFVGEIFTIDINMSDEVTGNFTVDVGGKTYIFNVGSEIKVFCDVSGLNIINITYNGDENYHSQSKITNITAKMVSIPSDERKLTVDNTKISIKLPNDATGDVTVNINGNNYNFKLVNGSGSVSISNLAAGTYTATVTYNGNNKYHPFSQSIKLTVKGPNRKTTVSKFVSKFTAKKKTFKVKTKIKKYTVTLKTGTKPIKKAKLTLKIKGKTYKATTNSKGKATFKITKLNKKGNYNAVIKFNGNSIYKSVSKKVKISVKK